MGNVENTIPETTQYPTPAKGSNEAAGGMRDKYYRLLRVRVEPDAVYFFACAGSVKRPVRQAPGHFDFVPGIRAGLHFHGAGAVAEVAVCGARDFGDNGVECIDGVCVHHGYHASRRASEEIWNAGSGVWSGICGGSSGRRPIGAL